jgi:hypothetical protein
MLFIRTRGLLKRLTKQEIKNASVKFYNIDIISESRHESAMYSAQGGAFYESSDCKNGLR